MPGGAADGAGMTLREWQQLTPDRAARELHRRAEGLLAPAQRTAAIAALLPEAELADAFARANRSGPLGGVPCLVKDLFDVAGLETLAGSTFLARVRPAPSQDSALVTALRSAGAVVAGKTHLHEFAYGITGENPHYGDCEHPRFPGRTSGGSSSGSAVAVAAGIVPLAFGTDTGGSIRVPAAFCGLYGLRLRAGGPYIRDAFPLARSFDSAGWFANTAADLLTSLRALVPTGEDRHSPVGCYFEPPGVDPDVAVACRAAAQRFAAPAGSLLMHTLLEGFRGSLDAYHRIVASEAWSVHSGWADRFRTEYDPTVWGRLESGRNLSARAVGEAEVVVAATRLLWAKFFSGHDFLVLPATPFGALTKPECTPENRNRLLALTAPASLGGCSVLTIPVSLPSGLTSGLQIVAHDSRGPVFPWILEQCTGGV